jgi:hypothetical protein
MPCSTPPRRSKRPTPPSLRGPGGRGPRPNVGWEAAGDAGGCHPPLGAATSWPTSLSQRPQAPKGSPAQRGPYQAGPSQGLCPYFLRIFPSSFLVFASRPPRPPVSGGAREGRGIPGLCHPPCKPNVGRRNDRWRIEPIRAGFGGFRTSPTTHVPPDAWICPRPLPRFCNWSGGRWNWYTDRTSWNNGLRQYCTLGGNFQTHRV